MAHDESKIRRCGGCAKDITEAIYANGWCNVCRSAAKELHPRDVCEANRIYDTTDGRVVVARWKHQSDNRVPPQGAIHQCRHCHRLYFASKTR
jgi:hypothetical protein